MAFEIEVLANYRHATDAGWRRQQEFVSLIAGNRSGGVARPIKEIAGVRRRSRCRQECVSRPGFLRRDEVLLVALRMKAIAGIWRAVPNLQEGRDVGHRSGIRRPPEREILGMSSFECVMSWRARRRPHY